MGAIPSLIAMWVPLIVDCENPGGCDGHKRAAPTAAYGASPLVHVGREPVMPAHYGHGARILLEAEGGRPWFDGQAYAVAAWDGKTGKGELRREVGHTSRDHPR